METNLNLMMQQMCWIHNNPVDLSNVWHGNRRISASANFISGYDQSTNNIQPIQLA